MVFYPYWERRHLRLFPPLARGTNPVFGKIALSARMVRCNVGDW